MDSTNSKEMELIKRQYRNKDKKIIDVTFEIANNTLSPFQSVDYLINGVFETVGTMGDDDSIKLTDQNK
jgi:hypothetical protein